VNSFYTKVQADELLGHVFNDVAQVNWERHLPVMYSFWETVLFGVASFKGDPMGKHVALSDRTPLTEAHFTQWLHLWHGTVNEFFEGKTATSAKDKASLMKTLMLGKVQRHQSGALY
jgi:hemoglobin